MSRGHGKVERVILKLLGPDGLYWLGGASTKELVYEVRGERFCPVAEHEARLRRIAFEGRVGFRGLNKLKELRRANPPPRKPPTRSELESVRPRI